MLTPQRSWPIALIGLLLLSLLAGGLFTLSRMWRMQQPEAVENSSSGRVIDMVAMADGGAPLTVRTRILPAPELPLDQPGLNGVLLERQDNRLLIGTGSLDLEADIEVNSETGEEIVQLVPSTAGPDVEVIIGVDTLIYADVTDLNADMPTESGEREVQQIVRRVDSLTDLPAQAEVQVWGRQRGDRLTAEILVYAPLGGGMFE